MESSYIGNAVFGICFGNASGADKSEHCGGVKLEPNTPYEDVFTTSGEMREYEFTMPEDGMVTFSFVADLVRAENSRWKIYIKDKSENELEWEYLFGNTFESLPYNFKKGTRFYVVIKECSITESGLGCPFTLEAKYEKLTNWEIEESTDNLNAINKLTNKKTMNGILHVGSDDDWFKYTIPANGKTTFTFQSDESKVGKYGYDYDLTFFDKNKNRIYYKWGAEGKYTSPVLNFKKGTVLYVKVEPGLPAMMSEALRYSLTANTVASKKWEVEGNDTFAKATKITATKMNGTRHTSDDVDYYVWNAKGSKYQIKLHADGIADYSMYNWVIRIYDKNKKMIGQVEGADSASTTIKTKKGQKYYIRVSSGVCSDYTLTCKKK